MNKNLKDIDIKVIKFLLSAGVYSDLAIVKNLGITYEELDEAYLRLLKEGYLETYEEYQKRELEECSNHSNCESCSTSTGVCGGCCSKKSKDYSDVKVITWKAIEEFQE
ncbi:hypothetical protein [uncultured Fusobacterium sp.]|uniref:hypothetical protein n=1 Tax=uncultured Fusobacterium sp. TaxID=159267 RepID=UPI0025CE2CC7|nr:hypothetical protein [uncultured Fusobacterium sp.]